MKRRKESGFTLIEMMIVLALMVVLLAIAAPTAWEYYRRQRFDQAVQSLVANLKAAQIKAISTGYWYVVKVHANCPYRPGRVCVQAVRLPQGECSAASINWTGVTPCTSTTPPSQVCEEQRLRAFTEIEMDYSPASNAEYVISPLGMLFMFQPGVTVCTALPIPNPPYQMTFSYPKGKNKWSRGICVFSTGLIKKTHTVNQC